MGSDVWEAMMDWRWRQAELQDEAVASRGGKRVLSLGVEKAPAGYDVGSGNGQRMTEQWKEREKKERSKETCKQQMADSEQIFRNKKATKKWMEFAEYQRLHELQD